jgi:predicted nucleic acid-binding protein
MVLDSTILIDVLRRNPAAVTFLKSVEEPLWASEISRLEIIQGLRSPERKTAERLFSMIGWVPVDESVARHAGELGRKWRNSHTGIDPADLAIAATAEQLERPLATRNIKHFPMFKGLKAPY